MLTALRNWAKSPRGQFAIAGAAITYGVRRLVELTQATRADVDELVELHAETRTRVFALETIEEGRRALVTDGKSPSDRLSRVTDKVFDDSDFDQATEEVQQ